MLKLKPRGQLEHLRLKCQISLPACARYSIGARPLLAAPMNKRLIPENSRLNGFSEKGFSEKSLRNDFSKESGDRSEGCSRGQNAFSISGRCPKSKIPAFRQLLFSLHAFL